MIVANHASVLDFVNLLCAGKRVIRFVISRAYYYTLPFGILLRKMGLLEKQQFQTNAADLMKMNRIVRQGYALAIYPAGLMCADGRATPIPNATGHLLKWIDADVYAAVSSGAYFVRPKWARNFRPGKTKIDIYRLFTKQELRALTERQIQSRLEQALDFDDYQTQRELRLPHRGGSDLRGLENVLYRCPCCAAEFQMQVRHRSTIVCGACGFAETGDELGFLHHTAGPGEERGLVSQWSRENYACIRTEMERNDDFRLAAKTDIQLLDCKKRRFCSAGEGTLVITRKSVVLDGRVNGQAFHLEKPAGVYPTVPFVPGRCLDLQDHERVYRCVPQDGKTCMKLVHGIEAASALAAQTVCGEGRADASQR